MTFFFFLNLKLRKVKMTAGTLTVAVMVTITAVSTEKCQKLDPVLWDYTSCPHPDNKAWIQLKIKMNCDKHHDYHCASNSQGCDVQLCVKKVYCEAGHRPLLDPAKDTAICAPCPPDRYQATGFWSNQRSYCEREKTKCDGDGQMECQPGSAITDRSCRCNIHQNLALQSYALHNKTCCTKNDQWCECIQFKSPCPNGTVRHDNYKCLKECPPNSFRLWNSETCIPNSTTVTVEMTTAHQTSTSGSTGLPDTVNVGLLVGLIIVGLGLVGLIVGLWVCHIRTKRKKDLLKDEEQAGQLEEQISGKGRPGEKTSNGHIDGHEQVDMGNGHIDRRETVDTANDHRVHVENHRKCLYASSVSEDTEKKYLLQSPGAEAGSSTKGKPGEKTSNGHIDGHKQVDMANRHRVQVEDYRKCRYASSVSEEEATEKDQLLQSEVGSSTKGKDLRENKISNEGERVGDESLEALLQPLVKEMTGGQVIVKNLFLKSVYNSRDTNTNVHNGRGNTVNLGKNHETKTTIYGNEDIGSFESMKSTSGRSSLVAENPDNQLNSHINNNQWNSHSHNNQWNSHINNNQWNSHSHNNQWNSHSHDSQPQPEIKEESTGSLFNDAESEHRPVEHEEQVMTELKLHTDISRIGSSSEETAVKLTGSDPHESMEEVRTEELCKPIQDDDSCSNDETKKKEFFCQQKK